MGVMADGTMNKEDLRDWFAGMAMSGLYSGLPGGPQTSDEDLAEDARIFYRIADAMLAARSPTTDEATK